MDNTNLMFSIVISCYNSRKYITDLLNSLVDQGIDKSEYEVIIADDYSPDPFLDILEKYESKLTLRRVVADKNYGYPGHTRQMGLDACRGEWVIFSDHDDTFFKNSLKKVKDYILKNKPQYAIYCNLKVAMNKYNPGIDIKKSKEYIDTNNSGVTHGKVYNIPNLIKKYDIHYTDKFFTNEDIYFSSLINVLIDNKLITVDYADIDLYLWTYNVSSISSSGGTFDWLSTSYLDFIRANMRSKVKMYKKGICEEAILIRCTINLLLHNYFAVQVYRLRDSDQLNKVREEAKAAYNLAKDKNMLDDNTKHIATMANCLTPDFNYKSIDSYDKELDLTAAAVLQYLEKEFNYVNIDFIMSIISEENGKIYMENYYTSVMSFTEVIEVESIYQFLSRVESLDTSSIDLKVD